MTELSKNGRKSPKPGKENNKIQDDKAIKEERENWKSQGWPMKIGCNTNTSKEKR